MSCLFLSACDQGQAQEEQVQAVIDGDTVLLDAKWSPYELEWKVRIKGVDTPEKGKFAKCSSERVLAKVATIELQKLLKNSGNKILLSHVSHDKYGGRILAEVYLPDGRKVSDILISKGVAKPYHGRGPKPNWCHGL
jgi:endonuclease YncB( thermonuclease family)